MTRPPLHRSSSHSRHVGTGRSRGGLSIRTAPPLPPPPPQSRPPPEPSPSPGPYRRHSHHHHHRQRSGGRVTRRGGHGPRVTGHRSRVIPRGGHLVTGHGSRVMSHAERWSAGRREPRGGSRTVMTRRDDLYDRTTTAARSAPAAALS